jgi:hypothetical protein
MLTSARKSGADLRRGGGDGRDQEGLLDFGAHPQRQFAARIYGSEQRTAGRGSISQSGEFPGGRRMRPGSREKPVKPEARWPTPQRDHRQPARWLRVSPGLRKPIPHWRAASFDFLHPRAVRRRVGPANPTCGAGGAVPPHLPAPRSRLSGIHGEAYPPAPAQSEIHLNAKRGGPAAPCAAKDGSDGPSGRGA